MLLLWLSCKEQDPAPAVEEHTPTEPLLFARLTHRQWENTVRDLLYLPGPANLSQSFLTDPVLGRFDNDEAVLQVSPELRADYQRAAESLAARVAGDIFLYAQIAPEDSRSDLPTLDRREGDDPRLEISGGAVEGTDVVTSGEPLLLQTTFTTALAGVNQLEARLWASAPADLTLSLGGLSVDIRAGLEPTEVAVTGFLPDGEHTATLASPAGPSVTLDWISLGAFAPPLGTSTSGMGERDAWIERFGERAFRRPLTDSEIARYTVLFDSAPATSEGSDPFSAGVALVIEAMLQSPSFLYRTESVDPDSGRLSSYSAASRLSYAIWGSMPDEELLEAAAFGGLDDPEVYAEQAARLLDDPRAGETIADFARQLLELERYVHLTPDEELFPDAPASLQLSMQREALLFVGDIFESGGSYAELLTAPRTFVNGDIAGIYGLTAQGDDFVAASLDPAQRAGLLTLSGALAASGDGRDHSPIRRGVYVNRRILCTDLPPPPGAIPPPPEIDPGSTTRAQIEALTGEGTCGEGCHSTIINPIGLAYEHYDALGYWRDEEHGQPIDASGSFPFGEGPRSFTDAVDLANLIAGLHEPHRCLTEQLLQYTYGRSLSPADDPLIEALASRSLAEDLPIREILLSILIDPSFLAP